MKKHLFTFLFTSLTLLGFSQITITNANIASAGVTIIQANDTVPDSSIVPGDAGANQSWNFAALSNDSFDTLYTELPDWTPYADSFPTANYAIKQLSAIDTSYIFCTKNNDLFASLGYVGSMDEMGVMAIYLEPQEVFIDFPMEYGNQRNESFYFDKTIGSTIPGIDSIRFKNSTEKTVTVDAWGDVTLPTGTYNSLRAKTIEMEYDSSWILMAGNWTLVAADTIPSTSYDWFTNEINPGFVLLSMYYNDNVVSDVSYLYSTTVGIQHQNKLSVTLSPNPVESLTTLQLSDNIRGEVRLYNQTGIVIKTMAINGSTVTLNMESLPAGIYIAVVIDKTNNTRSFTGKIVKR
ncbi:MAG: hypothetical protein DRJ09_03640 [Bacteroidetes bacterium]|nr:MAG: hypothetical protein DRJ09_03640 [Bacteroidota bacterium]